MESRALLIVDDDTLQGEVVRSVISEHELDFTISLARDGWAAIEVLLAEPTVGLEPRLVLLDDNMPRMSGLEFLAHLRSIPELEPTRVILVCSVDDQRLRAQARNLRVDCIVSRGTIRTDPRAFAKILRAV